MSYGLWDMRGLSFFMDEPLSKRPPTFQQVIVLISSPSHISPKSTNSSTVSSLKMILFHDCMKIQEGKAFFHKEAAKHTCSLISNLFMSDRAQHPKEIGKQSILNR